MQSSGAAQETPAGARGTDQWAEEEDDGAVAYA